jgi:hypothetical protein
MVAVLAITTSTITGILASYIIQQVNVQNKTENFVVAVTNSVKKNPSSGAASPNWSGPHYHSLPHYHVRWHRSYIHF